MYICICVYIENSLNQGSKLDMVAKSENVPNNSQKRSKWYQNPYPFEGLHVTHMSELKEKSPLYFIY